MKTAIFINPGAGSVRDRAAIEQALGKAGLSGEIHWLKKRKLVKQAKEAVSAGAQLVIAGGGDGTLSCIAGVLAGSKTVLGILPLGTLNHLARDLKIPLDLEKAAKLISAGRTASVDVAEVNGRVFVNNSAIGLYPLLVTQRKAQDKKLRRRKKLATAVAAAQTLLRFSRRRLTLTVNDHKAAVDTPLLFVGNNRYRLEMPGAGTRDRLDSGELCVVVLRSKSRAGFFAAAVRALLGRERNSDLLELNDVHELRVDSSSAKLRISLDGETALMDTPLNYSIRPKALQVVVP
jgi:YegS/Rv2252/BmrU family lipid kinase